MSVIGKAIDLPILKRIFTFVKPYRGLFIGAVLLTVTGAVLGPIRPWLTQYTLDNYVVTDNVQGLFSMAMVMTGVLVLQTMVIFLQTFTASQIGQNVIRDLRVKLYRHILNFRMPFFDKTPIGTPVTRTVSDIETIADVFADGIIIIIGDILQLIVILAYMLYLDWHLTLVSLATVPLLIIATNIFKNSVKRAFSDVRTQVAALNVFVQEHITGMRIVQTFNKEDDELGNFRAINKKHMDANIRSIWAYSIFFPVVEILSAISIGLVVWWGAGDVIDGKATFGTLVAFIMYIGLMFRPMRELADKFNTLQMGMVSSERIFKMLDTPSGIRQNGNIRDGQMKGEIEFRDVWFAYNNEDWVLKGINLKIRPGETVAFVGATGAGKSTIINLITRLYDIQKGKITIDGVDIKDYDISFLRGNVAIVLQDVFLFSDSIYQNITLGDDSIDPGKVRDAASSVGASGFIEKLPGGYDYNVNERGVMLSMGQRQLISFIRAYVRDPSVLVLDEATSSIDPESELLISEATTKITQGRTSLVIAHRLSTIKTADRIVVMDHGRVAEEGTHAELLARDGSYRKLYDIQFRHFDQKAG